MKEFGSFGLELDTPIAYATTEATTFLFKESVVKTGRVLGTRVQKSNLMERHWNSRRDETRER